MGDFFREFESTLRAEGYEPIRTLQVTSGSWPRLRYNGEKPGQASGGYKVTQNPDGSYFAVYGSSKDPNGFRNFRLNRDSELSYAELVAAKVAREEHRREMMEQERRRHEKLSKWLTRIVRKYPLATVHPYLDDKNIGAHGIRIRPKTGDLVIPRYDGAGRMWSVQRIAQRKSGVKSWKGYMKGAFSKGLYFPLATKAEPKDIIIICEGFATAATLREVTKNVVIVAFDSGQLVDVASTIRKKYPDARIIIAGDNDQWTFKPGKKPKDLDSKAIAGDDARWLQWRDEDRLHNPGLLKAQQAAAKIGGAFVLVPDFAPDAVAKGTDFNDYVKEFGEVSIREQFEAALATPQRKPEAVEKSEGSYYPEAADYSYAHIPESYGHMPEDDSESRGSNAVKGDLDMNFRVLGYNAGNYYYYPYRMGQIVTLTSTGHSINNLLQLDTLDAWERSWRDGTGKLMARHPTIALYAAEAMIRLAEERGVFAEEDRARGCGAWIDDGRVILHCGDAAFVDGDRTELHQIPSKHVYLKSARMFRPAQTALTNKDARKLRDICEMCTWENKLSGSLLAGWLVVAPICAALQFRPHIFITGESGAGKSTVMDMIIKPVLGTMSLNVDGKTSEPSIRQRMGHNVRPLVFDEAEPGGNMEDVISLARLASTGGVISKAGQQPFKARFAACFTAVTPPIKNLTDESRITFMVLKKNHRATALEEYDRLLALIADTITEDYAERLLARTLENMQALLTNIRVFQRAARKVLGGPREAQKIGCMLAGLYLLGRTDTISEADAETWISANDWNEHANVDREGDPIRLVQWITGSLVRYAKTGSDISVGELIDMAHRKDSNADKFLRYYGIAVRDERVDIASRSQNLARLLNGTDWQNRWSRPLADVPGAEKKASVYFSRGVKTSAISLPLELFIGTDAVREDDEDAQADEMPPEHYDDIPY